MEINNFVVKIIWRPLPILCITLGIASASLGFVMIMRGKKKIETVSNDESNSEPKKIGVGVSHPYTDTELYNGCIYLDYNATTPIYPEITSKIIPFLTNCFGNPSSSHIFSDPCKNAVKLSRSLVGNLINAASAEKEIFFTSCGTESDNRAIDIAIENFHFFNQIDSTAAKECIIPNVITSAIEHPAVLSYLRVLKCKGHISLTIIDVDEAGFVKDDLIQQSLTKHTALVTIMHSNNEVGTIQPIRKISDMIRKFNNAANTHILLHSDAAQSIGKVSIDVQSAGIDLLTIVGHKYGAPKGVAALYVKEGLHWQPMLVGGGQENGARGGIYRIAVVVFQKLLLLLLLLLLLQ